MKKRLVFFHSDKKHELLVAEAFMEGALSRGFQIENRFTSEYKTHIFDVAIVMGVKGATKQIMTDYLAERKTVIYIDKGYTRRKSDDGGISEYYRIAINSTQPTAYFQRQPQSEHRFEKLDYYLQRMPHNHNGHIIFAGSSQKYCDFHELGDATDYAQRVITELRKYTDRKIVYRPKPSWQDAVPLSGTTFSGPQRKIWMELQDAYALVTHGSNAAFDAILNGIPIIILGDGVGKPLARTELKDINNLYYPTPEERYQWCCDLAYCQWTLSEMRSGLMFKHIDTELMTK